MTALLMDMQIEKELIDAGMPPRIAWELVSRNRVLAWQERRQMEGIIEGIAKGLI